MTAEGEEQQEDRTGWFDQAVSLFLRLEAEGFLIEEWGGELVVRHPLLGGDPLHPAGTLGAARHWLAADDRADLARLRDHLLALVRGEEEGLGFTEAERRDHAGFLAFHARQGPAASRAVLVAGDPRGGAILSPPQWERTREAMAALEACNERMAPPSAPRPRKPAKKRRQQELCFGEEDGRGD